MKMLIDMNLSPSWVDYFQKYGIESLHWSQVGPPNAPDSDIMAYAALNGFVVFTHDLDFSALLATTNAKSPRVIQVRVQNNLPKSIGETIIKLLAEYKEVLNEGVFVTLDMHRSRVRILPMH